ncbi:MAG: acetate--CoA ligase family protein, partial [Thermomicrobiales bacterium]|nr:acetate--CoA ligase family protein [Thermomicrobiales bacterium]
MNIHEYQAAEILAKHGIPVNPGKVATTPEEARDIAAEFGGVVVVKAQVHTGGRGKAGGVKVVKSPDEAYEAAKAILGMDIKGHIVNKVLIAKGADIQKEVYISAVMNRPQRTIMVMSSAEGGVEIETVAEENPDAIVTRDADPFAGFHPYQAKEVAFALGLEPALVNGFATIAEKLYDVFMEEDATLVEINPFIINGEGKWQALDSKMSFDDNALYRHPETEALRDLA